MNAARIAVFGATGGTGTELVDQALGRGWQVVAVVRHEGSLTSHDGLRVIVGDPLDEAVAASAVEGRDAVLSALGFRRHLRARPTSRCTPTAPGRSGRRWRRPDAGA